MSRSKRARAKARRRRGTGSLAAEPRAAARTAPDAAGLAPDLSRFAPVRRRARIAKLGIGAAAVVGLGASMGLARVSYAGHAKQAVKTLSIPQPLYAVVRRNLLQSGILAPATAPPDATTSTS
jgi:hypothetical protein